MSYKYGVGIKQENKSFRKAAAGLATGMFLMASFSISAFAANDYCGASSNGCAHSMANTQCAGHGAFGAFGKDNNFAGGASGDKTGYYNSTLCGNPQGSAGTLGDHNN